MLLNVNEWKEKILNDRKDVSQNIMVRSMPALGFREHHGSYADIFVYPTFLFEELQALLPGVMVQDFYYRIWDTGTEHAKENVFVYLNIGDEDYRFRYAIDHKGKELAFYYSINFQPSDEIEIDHVQKETVFQLFQLAQSFLHTHSPHRLFLCTQQYKTVFPDIIYEKMGGIKHEPRGIEKVT